MDDYSKFIALSRYSRWKEDEQRRETWEEVVDRFTNYVRGGFDELASNTFNKDLNLLNTKIKELEIMPSMRALMTAGPALDRCNVGGYNCAYLPIEDIKCFDEAMYVLMNGTGVGFSVERQFTEQLPVVPDVDDISLLDDIVVEDSKEGWCRSVRALLTSIFEYGQYPDIDVSSVRPAGARLRTFGGRASGPEPLVDLHEFIKIICSNAEGRKLRPIECHDIMCKIAEIVVVGGVRRSALISLSDLDDVEMANAKKGEWWVDNPQRALANNSAVYTKKPTQGEFLSEWASIYESKSGERGTFNREAASKQAASSGHREVKGHLYGTNPCSEIILRPYQFCNLTEVVVREEDTKETLKEKVRLATLLGVIQSRWTDFDYLRPIWQQNCEEERLLGVSLTGVYDNVRVFDWLTSLRKASRYYANIYSDYFGINTPASTTCIKPSGTVSQLVNSASGLHPRFSHYYKRTVRGDNKDPMTEFLKDQGVEWEPCFLKPDQTTVFTFYQKAPEGSVTNTQMTAEKHLTDWLKVQQDYCEHKPSVTISVDNDEWYSLGAMVYKHFDEITGVSFLPKSDHTYAQAPYQAITEEQYKEAPEYTIDWSKLPEYEKEDTTTGSQELACSGGYCEIVDITS